MRVLLTGHKGYVGSVLAPMLLQAGYDVIGLDSELFGPSTCVGGILDIPEIRKDVRDVKAEDLDGIEAVLHLAALSNDLLGSVNSKLTYEINYRASVCLAALSKWVGVRRFIFASTCSAYGENGNNVMTEKSRAHPITFYGASKALAERDIAALASTDFSPVFLRSAAVYGVSPNPCFDLILNNLVAWAYVAGRVPVVGDGTSWLPLIHIEDVARAFIAALEASPETVHNEIFNIGRNEDNYRIQQLAEIVASIVPNSRIDYAFNRGLEVHSSRVDFNKVKQKLPSFVHRGSPHHGVHELVKAYQKAGLTRDELEWQESRRIGRLQQLSSAEYAMNPPARQGEATRNQTLHRSGS